MGCRRREIQTADQESADVGFSFVTNLLLSPVRSGPLCCLESFVPMMLQTIFKKNNVSSYCFLLAVVLSCPPSLPSWIPPKKASSPDNVQKFVFLLDTAKAFDSIDHTWILRVLNKAAFPRWLLQFVRCSLYDVKVAPFFGSSPSCFIPIKRGVKQGCPLPPLLCLSPMTPSGTCGLWSALSIERMKPSWMSALFWPVLKSWKGW